MRRLLLLHTLMLLATFWANAQFGDWLYNEQITINNTENPSTLTDYSVLVVVNTQQLIASGKMNTDGSDIRFTTNYSDDLSYWIDPGIQNERGINTAATHIWVKIPTIPGSANTTMYMLYGNTTASSKSNISSTFIFGDDFDDNILDESKWEVIYVNTGLITEENGRLEHHSSGSDSKGTLLSKMGFTGPMVLEMQFMKGGYIYRGLGLNKNPSTYYNAAYCQWQDWGSFGGGVFINGVQTEINFRDDYWSRDNNPEYYITITRMTDGTFSIVEDVPSTEPGGPQYFTAHPTGSMSLDSVLKIYAHDFVYASPSLPRYEDNIRVRKYSEPEPYTTFPNLGLVAYFPFNGNTNDESEYQNNGAQYGGVALTSDRFGNVNSAYTFDGVDDYIQVENAEQLNFSYSTPLSISGWFNISSFTASQAEGIVAKWGNVIGEFGYGVAVDENQKLTFALDQYGYGRDNAVGTTTIQANTWYHFVGTWDGSEMKLYLNSTLESTVSRSYQGSVSSQPLYIGKQVFLTGEYNGKIDDIRIYSRAISATETLELFNEANPGHGLMAYYPFNGNANDESGNGNNGTVNGPTSVADRFGNANSAYSFDGIDDLIEIAASSNLAWNDAQDFSVFAWVKPAAVAGRTWIVSADPANNGDFQWKMSVYDGGAHANIDNAGNLGWDMIGNLPVSADNSWYCIGYTYIGSSKEVNIYVNGQFDKSGISSITGTTVPISFNKFILGATATWGSAATEHFNGVIDDIRVYNKAISAAEILELYNEKDLKQGLIAHYPFCGTASDESGNGHHGTNYGATITTDRLETSGNAFSFDGTDDYVDLTGTIDESVSNALTLTCWINSANLAGRIISNWGSSSGFELNMYDNNLHFSLNQFDVINASLIGLANQWIMVSGTYDGSSVILFINGQPVDTVSFSETLANSSEIMKIGAMANGGGDYYTGKIDDVRIYNRALSAAEILLLFNKSAPIITTTQVTSIAATSASTGGNVTSDGGSAVTERGVVWSTAEYPTTFSNGGILIEGSGIGEFSTDITSLTASTTYYVRAYATNVIGTAYGQQEQFTTLTDGQEFAGGTGTVDDPYQVATASQLNNVRNYLSAHFIQTANIDLGVSPWNYDEGWEPIGNSTSTFTGTFNGKGYAISGLYISRFYSEYQGLFGYTSNATIKNIAVENVNIDGYGYLGAIVGFSYNSSIETSYSSGSISGHNEYTGGLVGYSQLSSIKNCFSRCSVSCNFYAGGLVSFIHEGIIHNSYSTGAVTGSNYLGGLLALNLGSMATISNSYWDTQTSGQTYSAGGEGRTTDQMTSPYDASTFVDWDFNLFWGEDFDYTINSGYPYLRMQDYDPPVVSTSTPEYITSSTAKVGGNVTADNGVAVTDRGIIWDIDDDITIEYENYEGLIYCGEGLGEFTGILQPLSPGTTYFYRAFAISDAGYGYGDVHTFATPEPIELCVAVDNCHLGFTSSGPNYWFGQSVTTHDGVDAVQSGYIGDNQQYYFTTTLPSPGVISFYWKTSSEFEYDLLQFFIDGNLMDGISGETAWEYIEYSITEGSHTLKWQFSKDGQGSEGQDCGWIDQIVFEQTGIPEVTSCGASSITSTTAMLCGNVTSEGSSSVTDRGVIWGFFPEISIDHNQNIEYEGNTGTGSFEVQATDLDPDTTYFYRAFALNSTGAAYGEAVSFTTPVGSSIYYVKQNSGNDTNDGTSWANAFATVQRALDAAAPIGGNPIQIWVAAGDYKPTSTYDLSSEQQLRHFRMKNNVELYGGFAGTETSLDQRNWVTNITYLSGDINGDDYWGGEWYNRTDNCYHVFYHDDLSLDNTAILDGFTIRFGNAVLDASHNSGGGMFNFNSSPTIRNVTFMQNNALHGGGALFNNSSESIISNSTFFANTSQANNGGGGGAVLSNDSYENYINVMFLQNYSDDIGGAVLIKNNSSCAFINVLFDENYAFNEGSALFVDASSPLIINSNFINNNNFAMVSATGSNSEADNCIFWNNSEGAILNHSESQTLVTYSIVQGGYTGEGNIDSDPQFVNLSEGDYRLKDISPCINTGTNWPFDEGEVADGITTDLDGNPRIVNEYVDMGVYEFQGTPSYIPVVTTNPVTGIGLNTATCGGNVTSDNGYAVTQRGVIWSPQANPTFESETYSYTEDGIGTGEFTSQITGLTAATKYYIRAYAKNQMGTAFGEEYEFTTHYVTLSNISANPNYTYSAISFTVLNGYGLTFRIKYGVEPNLSEASYTTETVIDNANYNGQVDITYLEENTVYYYQLIVSTPYGDNSSDTLNFRTLCSTTIQVVTPSGTTSVCAGDEANYSTSSDDAESFVWQLNPSNSGTITPTGSSATVVWSETYSGNANIEVHGVSGSCDYEISSLTVNVTLNVSDISISGETQVCNQSDVIYSLNRNAVDYTWLVESGGTIISSSPNHAVIRWSSAGSNRVSIVEQETSGCPSQSELSISVGSGNAPPVPTIHKKGSINILICTTAELSYSWFKDYKVIPNETKQFYVAHGNEGLYNVQIKKDQCPNTSNSIEVNSTGKDEPLLNIYPNPTSENINIEVVGDITGNATLSITNSFGVTIYTERVSKTDFVFNKNVNTSNFLQGLYIVNLDFGMGLSLNGKLTVY